ncbi:MAG TPA: WecB/TagA/CpsF family glycosyltransferase [Bryobacteraceae bacterium]|jgi:N-acetylglucosaminyldiphosphoundecaprenol N-acetyl-beta-D-mannosaminyltransferase|nr:WecB/TagA/CpsF family glycosyltransferase [Bryobacteraceae bacterium]
MPAKQAIPRVPRHSSALARKAGYAVSHLFLIDSFDPLKRALDATFAAVQLVFASPVMLCLALWRIAARKAVLTRTERIGRRGKRFLQYGFTGLEGRRVLRNLPVLFNILAGDMSFIGPRPAAGWEGVWQVDGHTRAAVRPGMVCYWWLRRRGNIDFDDEASVDREYVNTASLAGDFGIALRAIPALAFSEKREVAPRTVDILGVRIDNLSMSEALEWIEGRVNGEGQTMVCMTNAHCANVSCLDPAYYQAIQSSGLNLADGVGVRIAGKLKRTPIRQNVNGTDLFPRLCALLQGTGKSIYLLGGRPGVAEGVAEWIRARFPDTAIAGCRSGYMGRDEEGAVAQAIRDSGAAVLLVAMGVPQQELWIQRNLAQTGVRVALAVGGLFDFYSGRIPRAPGWMREMGLEWMYRLMQEPGRMWKRYLIGNWTFLARFLLYEWRYYSPGSRKAGGKHECPVTPSGDSRPVVFCKPD